MNPELPQVRPTQESAPQIPGSTEYFPDGTMRSPEYAPVPERQPVAAEQSINPSQTMPTVSPLPVAHQPSTTIQPSVIGDAPLTAADDELIEKEWVDKLKKIIALTKGKPYEQAKAIAILQADYLKKRHNRELGSVSD